MSASSNRKLRAESGSKMTEKQIAAQKEEQKVKVYTIIFAIVIVALVGIAAWVGISRSITASGTYQRNTTAVTINGHKLNNADLSYYYIDDINTFMSNYGSYASMFGLDTTKPLDQQMQNEETSTTWADYFIDSAKQSAAATIALVDKANEEGFTLSEAARQSVEETINTMEVYAALYGYSGTEAYIKAYYGNGAREDSYREYSLNKALASEYYTSKQESLTYTEAELRAAEAGHEDDYASFTFNQYYLSTSRFEGSTDAEKVAAAEADAKILTADTVTSVEAFDNAINGLAINSESEAKSTAMNAQKLANVSDFIKDWLRDSSRKDGDKTYIPSISTSTDEAGNETATTTGYYVLYFISKSDNNNPLVNVRHILVDYEGGNQDENGNTVYTDEEKAAAKAEAEAILNEWKAGAATEESFADLAKEKTHDTGSQENGGLYEDIYPGQMVTSFNDWCFDSSRQPGDTDVIETEYGYHVMYFVNNSDISYRDYMIQEELRSDDLEEWYVALTSSVTTEDGNTSYMRKDLVLQSAS